MSKFLNVSTGDYKVTVENGGDIVLDTGEPGQPGTVIVTGDLNVRGETTTVSSIDLVIEDNLIVLNKTSDGTELPLTRNGGTAGIEVARIPEVGDPDDSGVNVFWVFDKNLKWTDPQNGGTVGTGAWTARSNDTLGDVIGIEAVSITTPGTDLVLLGEYAGPGGNAIGNPGKLTVRGTVDYEDRIGDDDDIPNVKWVVDEITAQFSSDFQRRIQSGTFATAETYVEAQDDTVTSQDSRVVFGIDGNVVVDYRIDNVTLYNVNINGNTIQSTETNQDLILTANAVGSVVVDDDLILTKTPHNGTGIVDPGEPSDGVKLYIKEEGLGGSGVYFVSDQGNRDELLSKNRAIVYSMIF